MEEISRIAREAEVFFQTDAVKVLPVIKIPIDVRRWAVMCHHLGHQNPCPARTGRGLYQARHLDSTHDLWRQQWSASASGAGTEILPASSAFARADELSKAGLEGIGPAEEREEGNERSRDRLPKLNSGCSD